MDKIQKFLKQILQIVMIIGGIILSVLGFLSDFFDYPYKLKDSQQLLIIGLIILLLRLSWEIVDLNNNYVMGSKPKLKISCICSLNFSNSEIKKIAQISIENLEYRDITECYATLISLKQIFYDENGLFEMETIQSSIIKADRLKWDEKKINDDYCEITIPPRQTMILNLAISSIPLRIMLFLCQANYSPRWIGTEILCKVKIRIYGKFNQLSINPTYIEGFIYSETIRETQNNFDIQDLIFEKGDWTINEILRNNLESKKTKSTFKEILLKYLDNPKNIPILEKPIIFR